MHVVDITAILAFLAASIGLITAILNFLNRQEPGRFSFKNLLQKYLDAWNKYKTLFYLYTIISSIWSVYNFLKSTAPVNRWDIFFLMIAGLNTFVILVAIVIDRIFSIISKHLDVTVAIQEQFSGTLSLVKDMKELVNLQHQQTKKHLKTLQKGPQEISAPSKPKSKKR